MSTAMTAAARFPAGGPGAGLARRDGAARSLLVAGARSPPRGERGAVVAPRVGLALPRAMPFTAWLGVGAQLAAVATSSAWCLGDWLAYGQATYGSRYREAVQRTGLDYQTLRNYAWVAGRFELTRRWGTLSFGHHAEVAALPGPEQDFWLRKAEQFGWSTMRLRRQVRASLAERGHKAPSLQAAGAPGPPETGQRDGRQATIRVTLAPGQLELCERAAGRDGMTVHAWAARALEHAARNGLHNL